MTLTAGSADDDAYNDAFALVVDQTTAESEKLRENLRKNPELAELKKRLQALCAVEHNMPLAISTPVQSVWVNPGEMSSSSGDLARLAQLLELDVDHLRRLIGQRQGREFVYLRRHIAPDLAEQGVEVVCCDRDRAAIARSSGIPSAVTASAPTMQPTTIDTPVSPNCSASTKLSRMPSIMIPSRSTFRTLKRIPGSRTPGRGSALCS